MATITQLHGTTTRRTATRGVGVPHDLAASTLTFALIIALSIVVGSSVTGFAVAALFIAGMGLAALAQRALLPSEFAVVGVVHASAILLLAL